MNWMKFLKRLNSSCWFGHGDRLAERLESENRALRREVAALAAKLDRVAAASELTARVLDRVTSNGNAMRTEEA